MEGLPIIEYSLTSNEDESDLILLSGKRENVQFESIRPFSAVSEKRRFCIVDQKSNHRGAVRQITFVYLTTRNKKITKEREKNREIKMKDEKPVFQGDIVKLRD